MHSNVGNCYSPLYYIDIELFIDYRIIATLFVLLTIIATISEHRYNQSMNRDFIKPYKKGQLDYDIIKAEKILTINNGNGQNFELQQIAVDNNNDVRTHSNGQNGGNAIGATDNRHSKNGTKTNAEKILQKKDLHKHEQNRSK